MKRIFTILCVAIIGFFGAYAQKGDMGVGLNLGVAPSLEKNASLTNFGIGAKFQYNITNPIRLEADLDYWFKAKGMDMFDITANVHYLFNLGSKVKVYPIVGIGYASVGGGYSFDMDDIKDILGKYGSNYSQYYDDDDYDIDGGSSRLNRFIFNVGIGGEYAINSKLSAGIEIKYQYVKDFQRLPITVGATYHF
ncbi:MAG: outer membrane beta-barrel protein [Muribaculaceae bacterium]|nr:outer membrane beta-barrel protein [Muribaculaceae bacterium]